MGNCQDKVPIEIGDSVVYHDSNGKPHLSLITCIHTYTTINLVYVSPNSSEMDAYGRQIKRVTSVMHVSQVSVHGSYWRLVDEPINPPADPLEK